MTVDRSYSMPQCSCPKACALSQATRKDHTDLKERDFHVHGIPLQALRVAIRSPIMARGGTSWGKDRVSFRESLGGMPEPP